MVLEREVMMATELLWAAGEGVREVRDDRCRQQTCAGPHNFVVDKSIIITCRTEGTKRVDGK